MGYGAEKVISNSSFAAVHQQQHQQSSSSTSTKISRIINNPPFATDKADLQISCLNTCQYNNHSMCRGFIRIGLQSAKPKVLFIDFKQQGNKYAVCDTSRYLIRCSCQCHNNIDNDNNNKL